MTKKNVLLFFTDDQRFDTIAALGNSEILTPNLDALVEQGTSFTHAHIPGGTVGAVCMPSRAMLHTGKTLFRLKQNGAVIPTEHTMLGEVLQNTGYRTYGTGKWHNGPETYARSFTDGGEIFFGGMNDHWNVPAYDFDPTQKYDQTRKVISNPFYSNTVTTGRCDHVHLGKHSSELFCEHAANWIKQYDTEDPFFMYISLMAPHDPRSMPESFLKMYDPEKIKLPENFVPEHEFDYGVRNIRDELLAPYPRIPEEMRVHIAEYYAMITHLDHELGKVIEALKSAGKYEDTLIIFAGDNGLALGQHGLMGKQSAYEHSIRVPLIFAGPSIPKGETRDSYVYLFDIYPTLCELIGIHTPPSVEGLSLVPVIHNEQASVRDELYLAYADLIRAVKDHRYKLIHYKYKDETHFQLFDLQTDPLERINQYGEQDYEEITKKLELKLHQFRDEWDDLKHPTGARFWSS